MKEELIMLENEMNVIDSGEEMVNDSTDYISAIKEIKQNSIARSEYDKLKEENRKLLKSLVDGDFGNDTPQVDKEPVNIEELKANFLKSDVNNLDYIKNALALRNAIIEKDGIDADPFLPKGHNVTVTMSDYQQAAKVAEAFQYCVDYADGDSSVFTNELQRITKDNFVRPRKH